MTREQAQIFVETYCGDEAPEGAIERLLANGNKIFSCDGIPTDAVCLYREWDEEEDCEAFCCMERNDLDAIIYAVQRRHQVTQSVI